MKVAVTGASGFVGKKVLEYLGKQNADILALTRKKQVQLKYNCKWITTDYSYADLVNVFKDVNVVIHLAGNKGTKTQLSDYAEDMIITENILQAMGECQVQHIIYASSRLVYGNPENVPWNETTSLEPELPYGISKVKCEELCKEYSHRYNFKYSILRIAQVLGEGEGTKTMINVFQEQAKKGETLKVIGKSIAKRQYIYIDDLAQIIVKMIDMKDSEIINVGMLNAYTNYEIAELINKAFDNKKPIEYIDSEKESIKDSYMDVERLINGVRYVPNDMLGSLVELAKL